MQADPTQREKRGSLAKIDVEDFHLRPGGDAVHILILIDMMLVGERGEAKHQPRRKALCTRAVPPPPSTLLRARRSAVNQCSLEKYRWAFRRRRARGNAVKMGQ